MEARENYVHDESLHLGAHGDEGLVVLQAFGLGRVFKQVLDIGYNATTAD
jgi:hypothetical protein